jgi:type III restriction enzyme
MHEFLRPEERAKIDFARKHFEVIGTNIEFTRLEKDINQFMLQAISR